MLKELKFVQGAVAKKDIVPAMTHFAIEDSVVRSFNGIVALSSPIPFNIDCKPKAAPLVKAISHCNDTVSLSMTTGGRLKIVSGPFKAFIECHHDESPHVMPDGELVPIDGHKLREGLEALEPFIGNDASRPWTGGVLLRGHSAYATNNVVLAEYWMGVEFPYVINVPKAAIIEFLRIEEECNLIQISEKSITFHFSDKKWIRTALLATEWPDLNPILDKPTNPVPVPDELFEALESLKPFTDKLGRVFLFNGRAYTHEGTEEGASYDLPNFNVTGIYRIEMLELLKGIATKADLSFYPAPCLFFGDKLRGAIIGMKL